jgi:hypothetical protein
VVGGPSVVDAGAVVVRQIGGWGRRRAGEDGEEQLTERRNAIAQCCLGDARCRSSMSIEILVVLDLGWTQHTALQVISAACSVTTKFLARNGARVPGALKGARAQFWNTPPCVAGAVRTSIGSLPSHL